MSKQKKTHGGKRDGAGRPPKIPTKTMSFRVTEPVYYAVKQKHGDKLKDLFNAWIHAI